MSINAEKLASNHLRAVKQAESQEVKRMYLITPDPKGGFHLLSMLVDAKGEQGEARYEKARADGFCETKREAITNVLNYCAKRFAAEMAQLADWGAEIGLVIEPFAQLVLGQAATEKQEND